MHRFAESGAETFGHDARDANATRDASQYMVSCSTTLDICALLKWSGGRSSNVEIATGLLRQRSHLGSTQSLRAKVIREFCPETGP